MVVEVDKSKVKVLADSVCREGRLIGRRFFSLSFHAENKVEGSLGSLALTKVDWPPGRNYPKDLNIAIPWGLGFQHMNLEKTQHSIYRTSPMD